MEKTCYQMRGMPDLNPQLVLPFNQEELLTNYCKSCIKPALFSPFEVLYTSHLGISLPKTHMQGGYSLK